MGQHKRMLTDRQEAQRLGKLYPEHINRQATPSTQPTDTLGSTDTLNPRRCSFCNKHTDEVKKLVATPDVAVCNECTEVIVAVLYADGVLTKNPATRHGTTA